MNFIAHRRNTIEDLIDTNEKYGIEVDIRSDGEQLIIHHDAFNLGTSFETWIKNYKHGTLILNVKEEGLEDALLGVMDDHEIDDFFFLDQSFPFLVKTSRAGESRCAVRVSEFESIETALALAGSVDWVWVDCFSRLPIGRCDFYKLKEAGFKICLVSPELQGRTAKKNIEELVTLINNDEIVVDAICSKYIDIWEEVFCDQ
jgi:hypothetical protein